MSDNADPLDWVGPSVDDTSNLNRIVQCFRCPRRLTYRYVLWRDGQMLCATCASEVTDG